MTTRREQVYRLLRDDLMEGRHSPADRLREERLAEVYGVSRTPVREALARLLSDGLIQRDEGGLYPYRPRLEELAGLYELRIVLETHGISRAVNDDSIRHDSAQLVPELENWQRLRRTRPAPDAGFVTLDEQFHTVLLASSGNAALSDALATVNAKVRPVRMFDYLTPDRMEATITEHIDVAERVLDGDYAGALGALRSHIDESRTVVIERAQHALSLARMASAVRS